jgi:hypothetical protein
MRTSNRSSRIVRIVVAIAATSVMVAGCSDDDESSSATSPAASEADVCDARDALQRSLEALKDVDVRAEGTGGVEAAINGVKDDLEALVDSVGEELKPEVESVQDAVDELEAAVTNLDSGGAAKVLDAVSSLASSASTLVASLEDASCG